MKRVLAAVLFAAFLQPVLAHDGEHHDKKGSPSAAPNVTMIEGEIRRVDKEAKKLTIRHGPLVNLDMPAMTMVFQVNDPAFLDKVKAGDKVKFHAEKVGGAFVVTAIEPAP